MKKINVKLVAGLAIGLVVFMALTVFLHEFQSNRRADGLLVRANELKAQGEYDDAVSMLRNYLRRRPEEKTEYTNLALTMKQLVEQFDADDKPLNPNLVRETLQMMEAALRENPTDQELRDATIEFDMRFGRFGDAIVHLEYLDETEERRGDPDLRVKLAQCYFRSGKEEDATAELKQLIGYDDATRSFRVDQAMAPNEITAYVLLASIFERSRRTEQATAVMNQLIRVNNDNHKAYLARAGFLAGTRADEDSALRDIDRAVEIAPDDEIVLMAAGDFAMNAGNYDRAKVMYDRLRKVNPDNLRVYIGLSRWSAAQRDFNQSLDYLSTANEIAPENLEVLWQQANIELQKGDPEKAQQTLQQVIAAGAAPWYSNFLEGRIALSRKKWLLASEKLEAVRPMVSQLKPKWAVPLDMNLATCYDKLGKQDLRLSVLQRVLDEEPDNLGARLLKAQAHAALGQTDRAINDYEFLRSRELDPTKIAPKTLVDFLNLEILKQSNLDESQRNWKAAENIVRAIGENPKIPRPVYAEVMARFLIASGQTERAARVREKIRQQNPDRLQYALEDILGRAAESGGYEPAMADLQKLRKEKGDLIAFRILEANLVGANRPEDMEERLAALEQGLDAFSEDEQVELWFQLGRIYVGLRQYPDAHRVWTKFADLRPEDNEHAIRLFELSIISNDDEGAEAAMDRIERLSRKGRESAEWKWAKAAFITKEVRSQDLPRSALDEARALLNDAIAQRENWEPLHRLDGEIHLLDDDMDAAIEAYERAVELGSGNAEAIRRLARLYYEKRDFEKSMRMLEKLPRSMWEAYDQQINVDMMARTGQLPEDLEYDKDSKEPNDHLTIGGILARAGRYEEAEQAFRRAVQLDPTRSTTWGSLFELHMKMGDEEQAREVLQTAVGKVDDKNAPLLFGMSYHMLKDWDAAETEFKKALEAAPGKLSVLTSLAKVYLASNQREKAAATLAQMIKSEPAHTPKPKRSVAWARRALAEMISQNSTYEDFKKALALIEDNTAEEAILRPEDLFMYSQICARRPEAVTHREAIVKLERARDQRRLSDNELLVLAELYQRQDRWTECKSVMLDLLTRHAEDANYIVPWLSWAIDKKDYSTARTWVKKVPQDSLPAVRTRAHLFANAGNVDQAIRTVAEMVKKQDRTVAGVPSLSALAGVLEELGEFEPKAFRLAERVWQAIVKIDPRRTLQLAAFYNRRDDNQSAEAALQQCAAAFQLGKTRQLASLQMALFVIRKQYGRLMNDPKNEQQVRTLFAQAIKDHPESGTLLVLRSEFEDLMGNHDESMSLLRQFLERKDTHPRERALVQNNLAYKLGVRDESEESSRLIEEAIRILGPRSDLLDTKGVVQIAEGDYDGAIESVSMAIDQGGPEALKYFHSALAHWKSGDKNAAVVAMQDALQMDIDPATMIGAERQKFEDLRREMRREGLLAENT